MFKTVPTKSRLGLWSSELGPGPARWEMVTSQDSVRKCSSGLWEGSVLDMEKGSPLRSDSGQEQGWEKTTRSSPIKVRS